MRSAGRKRSGDNKQNHPGVPVADNKIEIQIDAGIGEFVKAIGSADRVAVKFADNVTKEFSPMSALFKKIGNDMSGAFKNNFNDIAKGVTVGTLVADGLKAAAGAAINFGKDSLRAFEESEAASNRLSFALKASGEFSQAALSDFRAFANQMQNTTKIEDDQVISLLALAKSLGATNEQAKQLVTAGANLSASLGGDVESRVEQLARTLTGNAGKLAQNIKGMSGLSEEALRAGGAISLVNERFGGSAQNELNTYAGKTAQLKNEFGDFQEEIGAFIAKNPATQKALELSAQAVGFLAEKFRDLNLALGLTDPTHDEAVKNATELSEEYARLQANADRFRKALAGDTSEITWIEKLGASTRDYEVSLGLLEAKAKRVKGEIDALLPTDTSTGTAPDPEVDARSAAEKAAAEKTIQDKIALQETLKMLELDYEAFQAQLDLQTAERKGLASELDYEQVVFWEKQKIDAVAQAELAKAKLIKDAGLKNQTETNIQRKAELDKMKLDTAEKKRLQERQIADARQESNTKLQVAQNFIQAGLALSKEGSAAQKALAITQATISTYQGATNALADTRPAWLGPAVAASIVAIGLANVARIAGAKFATGGIVGGDSYHGDKVTVGVNSGEMILRRDQQKVLFDDINERAASGSRGSSQADIIEAIRSMPIIVQANGREIARLVRDERANGFA